MAITQYYISEIYYEIIFNSSENITFFHYHVILFFTLYVHNGNDFYWD
jgi:hypothetical protein